LPRIITTDQVEGAETPTLYRMF